MWKSENPELIEDDEFRYEYNFLDERFKIICMPTPAHDSLQCFFNQSLVYSLGGKVGSRANELVQVGSGTSMLWDNPLYLKFLTVSSVQRLRG